uniref:Uncharacterized protein n=1 Tax=Anguilla anguilla TaxID=7936 RepID=A0A0E9VYJ2_ANGAN
MIVIWRHKIIQKNIPTNIVKLISNMKLSPNVHLFCCGKGITLSLSRS